MLLLNYPRLFCSSSEIDMHDPRQQSTIDYRPKNSFDDEQQSPLSPSPSTLICRVLDKRFQ